MRRYPDGTRQTSVGGHSGRKCGRRSARAFWFNHLVQSFLPSDTGSIPDCRRTKTVMLREAGHPVRRGLSIQSLLSLEYWVGLRSLSYGGQVARYCFFRHCERSEAIHLSVQEVTMDCFASLAMTVDTVSPSRGADHPRFAFSFAPLNLEGAGKTRCTLHPRSRVPNTQTKVHTSIQVQRKHSGLPCAWLYGL
jgi:hypothetical protein